MKKISLYKILPLTLICGSISVLHAQSGGKDTTYTRQISVERDFNPTLQDANKINALPSLYEPTVKKLNSPLADWITSGSPKLLQLTNTNAGNFGTDIEHDKNRGYAGLRLGTHGNIEGEAGYQAISNETTMLDFFGTYNASSAKPKHIDYLYKNDAKAKFSDAFFKVGLQHKFEPLTLFLSSSYQNEGFNYYGAAYASDSGSTFEYDKKQAATIFHLGAGIQSKTQTIMRYMAHLGYDNFGLKYDSIMDKGPKSGILSGDFNFNTDFGTDRIIGLNVHFLNQSLSKEYKDLHTFTHFKFNPYLDFTGSNWKATLGVNGHITFDAINKVLLVPNISASWNFLETSSLYGSVVGDVNENTYLDILKENRYVNPSIRISPSRTYYDAEIGIKSGIIKGLEFDFFTGYKYTSSEHLYVASSVGVLENVNSAIYANLNQGKVGGQIKTNLIPYVDLFTKLTTYFYKVKYRDEVSDTYLPKAAWNKPTYTFELNADIKPFDKFVVTANYLLAGGRKYYDDGEKKNMKSINELNAKGVYQFTKMVSASVSINNFLNQKYELVPGYANYGTNLLVGASVKF
jgi:outer membrane cobalamin receptor